MIRLVSLIALGLSVVWFLSERGYEPVITALLALGGLLSTRLGRSRHAAPPPTPNLQAGRPSVAVLPFEYQSDDAESFLADGITEDLIALLAQDPGLLVIARNSVLQYANGGTDVRRVGEELNVGYVVEGSVRQADGLIRVTARLLDAASGAQSWTASLQREAGEVFALQTELAQAIVEALGGEITSRSMEKAKRQPLRSLDAWGLLVRPTIAGAGNKSSGAAQTTSDIENMVVRRDAQLLDEVHRRLAAADMKFIDRGEVVDAHCVR